MDGLKNSGLMRRTILKQGLFWTIASQFTPAIAMGMAEKVSSVGEGSGQAILSQDARAALTVIVDTILPPTDTPGASQVGVVDFIELMLSGWTSAEEKEAFLAGLEDFRKEVQAKYGTTFGELTGEKRLAYLYDLQKEAASSRQGAKFPPFISLIKGFTVYGYYTSEEGAYAELNVDLAPGYLDACAVLESDERAPAITRTNIVSFNVF